MHAGVDDDTADMAGPVVEESQEASDNLPGKACL